MDSYAYDAWGNLIDRTGDTEQPYQYVGRLGYYTHYQDPAFNLLQLGVRFYDPEIGRFTERDAIGSGLNWYEYSRNNPALPADLTALGFWDWIKGSGNASSRARRSLVRWGPA